MAQTQIKRNFSGSYGSVYQMLGEKLVFVERDAAEFVSFGIDATKVTDIKTLRDAFRDTLTDNEIVGLQIDATQAKMNAKIDVMRVLRSIYTQVSLVFDKTSGQYKSLGRKNITSMTDIQLYNVAQIALRFVTDNKTILATSGVTDNLITQYTTKISTYHDTLYNTTDKQANRDIATQNRIGKANELWSTLKNICNIGQTIWKNDGDNAKANDYKIPYKQSKKKAVTTATAQTPAPATTPPTTTATSTQNNTTTNNPANTETPVEPPVNH